MELNTKIKTEQTLLSELVSISKALELISDFKSVETMLLKMAKTENQESFAALLLDLINSCVVLNVCAEYYDKNDYTEQYLVVNIDYELFKFSNINLIVAYNYEFSFDNRFLKNNCAYCIVHEGEELSYIEAEILFKKLSEEKRLELAAYRS